MVSPSKSPQLNVGRWLNPTWFAGQPNFLLLCAMKTWPVPGPEPAWLLKSGYLPALLTEIKPLSIELRVKSSACKNKLPEQSSLATSFGTWCHYTQEHAMQLWTRPPEQLLWEGTQNINASTSPLLFSSSRPPLSSGAGRSTAGCRERMKGMLRNSLLGTGGLTTDPLLQVTGITFSTLQLPTPFSALGL